MTTSAAYGAGYRAGMAEPAIVDNGNGTKVIKRPSNPYAGRWQVLNRVLWDNGYHDGLRKRLARPVPHRQRRPMGKSVFDRILSGTHVVFDGVAMDRKKITFRDVAFADEIIVDGVKVKDRYIVGGMCGN